MPTTEQVSANQRRRNTILMHQNRERLAFKHTLQERINRLKQKRKLKAVFSKTTELTDFLAMQDREAREGRGLGNTSDTDSSGSYNIHNDNVIIDDSYSSSESNQIDKSKQNLVTENGFVDALKVNL